MSDKTQAKLFSRSEQCFLAIIIAVIFFGCIASPLREYWRVHQAIAFCNSLIPKLERHREINGAYPSTLDGMIDGAEIPDIFSSADNRNSKWYSAENGEFDFTIRSRGGFLYMPAPVYYYSSDFGKWRTSTG